MVLSDCRSGVKALHFTGYRKTKRKANKQAKCKSTNHVYHSHSVSEAFTWETRLLLLQNTSVGVCCDFFSDFGRSLLPLLFSDCCNNNNKTRCTEYFTKDVYNSVTLLKHSKSNATINELIYCNPWYQMQMEEEGLTSLLPFLIQHILRLVHNECLTHDKRGKKAGMPSGNLQVGKLRQAVKPRFSLAHFMLTLMRPRHIMMHIARHVALPFVIGKLHKTVSLRSISWLWCTSTRKPLSVSHPRASSLQCIVVTPP